MIVGIYEGQTLWYNNITFTNSGLPRTKYAVSPTLCSVSNVSSDSYWTNFYLTPLSTDPDRTFRIYVHSDYEKYGYIGIESANNNLHTTWEESVKAYNAKIEKKIQWYRDQIEEGFFNSYCQEPFTISTSEESLPLNLNDDPGPISLVSLLLTAGKTVSGKGSGDTAKVGYVLAGSKRSGITIPWYPWEVRAVSTTTDNKKLVLSTGYYRTETIDCAKYNEDVYCSIYETKRDMLVNCLNNFDKFQENIAKQIDKKIARLEKLKILV